MTTDKSFWKAGHVPTLLSSFLYFDMSFMIWVLLGALGNYIAGDLGLSPTQKGLMTALPLLGGAALRLVLGALTDTIGGRKTGLIGMGLTVIPLFLGWLWAEWLSQIYLIGLLLGVAGASFAVALPLASRWYPAEHKGLAMGIAGAGNSGTVLATLFAPRLAEAFGWHAVFGLAIIPLLVAIVVFALFAKDAPNSLKKNEMAEYTAVLKVGDMYTFCFLYAVTFGGFVGLASFLSIFLRDEYGISKVAAGDLTTLCVVAGSFLRPLGGWLSDKIGGLRMLMIMYGAVTIVFLCVAQLPTLGIAVALFFVAMGCLGMGNGAVFQLVPQRFTGHVGVATGIIGAAGGVGGFFLPTLLGWFKQTSGTYATGLLAFAVVTGAALIALLLAQRQWVGNWIAKGGRAMQPASVSVGTESKAS